MEEPTITSSHYAALSDARGREVAELVEYLFEEGNEGSEGS